MWGPKYAFEPDVRTEEGEESTGSVVTPVMMLKGALAVGAAALVLFALFPGIDLEVTRVFYLGHGHFLGNEGLVFPVLRRAFNVFFYAICGLTVVGLIVSARTNGRWFDLCLRKWLFVGCCLLLGPLVVANIGLKDHWGRARPRNVIEFSGTKEFTPPFPPASQCDYNCSFVSGEASSMFIVFFAAAMVFAARSRSFAALGIALGGIAGLARIAQGGHFLSDVIFAGVFMAMTAAGIRLLFDVLEAGSAPRVEQSSR